MKQKLANALLQIRMVALPLSFCFCFWLSLEISFDKAVAGYKKQIHVYRNCQEEEELAAVSNVLFVTQQ
jgi:hypothetical protein